MASILLKASAFEMPLKDQSVDCIVTSPPYWFLRRYDIPDIIIGGDPNCEHDFQRCKRDHDDRAGDREAIGAGNPCCQVAQPTACSRCRAWKGQYGLEPTWQTYVEHTLLWVEEAWRVLKLTGSLWLLLGDTFSRSGSTVRQRTHGFSQKEQDHGLRRHSSPRLYKHKLGIPWQVRFALNEQGWISRSDVVWAKRNGMPTSVKDRLACRYEMLFHFVKQRKYYFDLDSIREPHASATFTRLRYKRGDNHKWETALPEPSQTRVQNICRAKTWNDRYRLSGCRSPPEPGQQGAFNGKGKNPGDVWTLPTQPYRGAHFATFPERLIEKPILASCPPRGVVLDPFAGTGTTVVVANRLGRHAIGLDLGYHELAVARLRARGVGSECDEEGVRARNGLGDSVALASALRRNPVTGGSCVSLNEAGEVR